APARLVEGLSNVRDLACHRNIANSRGAAKSETQHPAISQALTSILSKPSLPSGISAAKTILLAALFARFFTSNWGAIETWQRPDCRETSDLYRCSVSHCGRPCCLAGYRLVGRGVAVSGKSCIKLHNMHSGPVGLKR